MKDKPKYIEAEYLQVIQFDIEKLGINWNNVEEYCVKQKTLHVTYSNGLIEEYKTFSKLEIDWKHPKTLRNVFIQKEGKNSERDLWEEERRLALEETKNIDKWGKDHGKT